MDGLPRKVIFFPSIFPRLSYSAVMSPSANQGLQPKHHEGLGEITHHSWASTSVSEILKTQGAPPVVVLSSSSLESAVQVFCTVSPGLPEGVLCHVFPSSHISFFQPTIAPFV